MSASSCPKHIQIKRVQVNDFGQLPSDLSSTPGGTLFSTTPGGRPFAGIMYVHLGQSIIEIIIDAMIILCAKHVESIRTCGMAWMMVWTLPQLVRGS